LHLGAASRPEYATPEYWVIKYQLIERYRAMPLPGLLRAGQDHGVPLNVRDPLLAFGPTTTRWNRSHPEEAGRGPDPFRLAFCPGPRATPRGGNDVLVSAATATPAQSRTSFSASLGTAKDARKIGKSLFPVHRKATVSSSAASKV
jgi:hypothetical protein